MSRIALYTATVGGYESPSDILHSEIARAATQHVDYYRFTDDMPAQDADAVRSAHDPLWRCIQSPARLPGDSIRSARALKILGHPAISSHDVTIWIDNRVRLKIGAEELVERYLPSDADVAVPLHSYHASLADEFAAIVDGRFDDPRRVREQKLAYDQLFPNISRREVYWTAILIRRNSESIRMLNRLWWEQVLRYSRRDQLSLPFACASLPQLKISPILIDNFSSDIHEWRKMSDVARPAGAGHWQPSSLSAELFDNAKFLKDKLNRPAVIRQLLARTWGARS